MILKSLRGTLFGICYQMNADGIVFIYMYSKLVTNGFTEERIKGSLSRISFL
jgi:hypothetical protein